MTEAHLNIYDLLQSLEEQFPSNPLAAFSTQPSSISNSIETSPNSSSKTSIQYKQITIAKNLTKRIKAHPKTKQCIKTIKGKNFIKKRIQKICKIPLKNPKSEDLIKVSGSTLTSNATPKIGEYLQEITSLRQEDIKFNSSQEQINAFFLDGTLRKYKEEEVKFFAF